MRLTNKVAIVTGAGRGMGRAFALRLAEEGARVGVLDLRLEDAAATLALLPNPAQHLALACNVSDSAAINAAFAQVHAALGGLHVLVNNAGTGTGPNDGSAEMYGAMAQRNAELAAGGPATTFVDQTLHMQDEGWRAVMGVNLDGAFWGCRAAIRLMAQDGHGGSLINISSTAAQSGEGPVHYVTSKAALIGLTRGLAREVAARGIRVNAVVPGPTDTPLMRSIPDEWIASLEKAIPLGRLGRPDEVASAVAYLASDESSYITGSALTVNGGSYFL
jgi:3-oxoacyl-[acyl-carrier protein] reductase